MKTVLGILAHVDAGKTTLAEAILYTTGQVRKIGRVDNGDTALDTHALERRRGITIFASEATFAYKGMEATLIDTPGHVDFSAETERALCVLDAAILVISATEGVQAHTRTLWRLLSLYRIPTFVFVTKMDFARRAKEEILAQLRRELGSGFVELSEDNPQRDEEIALLREDLLEEYLAGGTVSPENTATLIRQRLLFPVSFGSGLKLSGVEEFLDLLKTYTSVPAYGDTFGARVYKITHDRKGERLTHLKVTGGTLRVRDTVRYGEKEEKIAQIRIYNGAKYETADEVDAGGVCAVTGLALTKNGEGLGFEADAAAPVLEPVMRYRVDLPAGVDERTVLPKLKLLEQEDPQLHVRYDTRLSELQVEIMGEVQKEVLLSIVQERFSLPIRLSDGRILYKETIENTVEGVGHFEPLRHYAEVHLLLSPLPRGEGLVFESRCPENTLDKNWQRLILTHLREKQHLGVLTGAPITDMKITLVAGRAHVKHTEGGDFREATYRAVRQGLMVAKSTILEPYYAFRLTVPARDIGRAVSDIRLRHGTFDPPVNDGDMAVLVGRAPISTVNEYPMEIAAYTGGVGRIAFRPDGYDVCHDPDRVCAQFAYDPTADLANTPDSVFCERGGGFVVKWDEVKSYMHLESCLSEKGESVYPKVNHRNIRLTEKELEALMLREFGPIKRPSYRPPAILAAGEREADTPTVPKKQYLIVDGYNVIFAWEDLAALAREDLAAARGRLIDVLVNFSAYTKEEVVLVFDAYNVPGRESRHEEIGGVHVVYTKENELGDVYIEKFIAQIGKNDRVRVVTSDGLIQLTAVRVGVLRMSSREFEAEVERVFCEIRGVLEDLSKEPLSKIGDVLSAKENK